MIKPYLKSKHTASIVEVEDFGITNLNELPIRVRTEEKGVYEIVWALTRIDGKDDYILSECGGRTRFDYGGRNLGVIREVE
ncbi:hypothetical protein [Priestia megaterium]|uniref:hypothetical protein n=1 Tax=Priestia megaterium TaxID=1404 RepID=UPI0028779C1E|nr:hypothetical protein [Priestia megaterium]